MTDKVVISYNNGRWSVVKDPTRTRWVGLDLSTGTKKINDLEMLVSTGVSRTEIEDQIKLAEAEIDGTGESI